MLRRINDFYQFVDIELLFKHRFGSDVWSVGVVWTSSFFDISCYLSSVFHLLLPGWSNARVRCSWGFVYEEIFNVFNHASFAEYSLALLFNLISVSYEFLNFFIAVYRSVPLIFCHVVCFCFDSGAFTSCSIAQLIEINRWILICRGSLSLSSYLHIWCIFNFTIFC